MRVREVTVAFLPCHISRVVAEDVNGTRHEFTQPEDPRLVARGGRLTVVGYEAVFLPYSAITQHATALYLDALRRVGMTDSPSLKLCDVLSMRLEWGETGDSVEPSFTYLTLAHDVVEGQQLAGHVFSLRGRRWESLLVWEDRKFLWANEVRDHATACLEWAKDNGLVHRYQRGLERAGGL